MNGIKLNNIPIGAPKMCSEYFFPIRRMGGKILDTSESILLLACTLFDPGTVRCWNSRSLHGKQLGDD